MEIKVLGTGCSSCKALYETTKQAIFSRCATLHNLPGNRSRKPSPYIHKRIALYIRQNSNLYSTWIYSYSYSS